MFQGSKRPVAALPLALLIATLFGMSPALASTTPGAAPATPSDERVTGSLQLALTPVLDTSEPYLTVQDGVVVPPSSFVATPVLDTSEPYLTVMSVAADLGTPSGGFSSAPGMYPPDTSAPSAPTVSDLRATGLPADLCIPSGGFSSAPGMYPPDTSATSAPTVCDLGATGLPADLGTPSGGFSSAPGMYPPDPTVSPANAKQP